MKLQIHLILLFIFLTIPKYGHAKLWSTKNFKTLNVTLGTWMEFYDHMQTTESGELNNDFEFTPYIALAAEYKLPESQFIIPEVGYVFREKTSDGSTTIDRLFMRADYAYMPREWIRFRLGSSFIIQTIAGDGGSKELPNGSGTETYYVPEERRNSYNQTLDYGVEFFIDRLTTKFQGHVYAFAIEEERMTTYTLSINYRIPFEELR
jgi:hypothetical protein